MQQDTWSTIPEIYLVHRLCVSPYYFYDVTFVPIVLLYIYLQCCYILLLLLLLLLLCRHEGLLSHSGGLTALQMWVWVWVSHHLRHYAGAACQGKGAHSETSQWIG